MAQGTCRGGFAFCTRYAYDFHIFDLRGGEQHGKVVDDFLVRWEPYILNAYCVGFDYDIGPGYVVVEGFGLAEIYSHAFEELHRL